MDGVNYMQQCSAIFQELSSFPEAFIQCGFKHNPDTGFEKVEDPESGAVQKGFTQVAISSVKSYRSTYPFSWFERGDHADVGSDNTLSADAKGLMEGMPTSRDTDDLPSHVRTRMNGFRMRSQWPHEEDLYGDFDAARADDLDEDEPLIVPWCRRHASTTRSRAPHRAVQLQTWQT